MNPWWLSVAGSGLILCTASVAIARKPSIGPVEARVFHAVNGLPGCLYPLLWPPMQLGDLVVGSYSTAPVPTAPSATTAASAPTNP